MSQELVNNLNSQVEKRIHGPKREQILKRLEGDPSPDALAEFTLNTITAIDAQAASRGAPLDIEVLLGVATETIDMLIEILEAMGTQVAGDEFRAETLIKVLLLHMKTAELDEEEKANAQELLKQLAGDGTLGQSMDYIVGNADKSPEEIIQAGGQMAGPQQKPLAAGVQQGLMQPQGAPNEQI